MNTVRTAFQTDAPPARARVRVRTPGKHIVMFLTAAGVIVAAASHFANAPEGSAAAGAPPATKEASRVGGDFAIPEFLVDLAPDRDGRAAYLRLAAVVRAAPEGAEAVAARIAEREAEISERVTFLLRGLSADDFDGEERLARVKAELLRRVNLVIAPARADDVLIADLVIQ